MKRNVHVGHYVDCRGATKGLEGDRVIKRCFFNVRLLWWIHPKLPVARIDTLLKVGLTHMFKIIPSPIEHWDALM